MVQIDRVMDARARFYDPVCFCSEVKVSLPYSYLTATIELDQQQIKSLGNTSTAGHLGNIIGRKHCIPKYIYIEQSFYYVHIGNIFGQILGKQRCFDQSHI
jgi:hypothetical protein